MMRKDICSTARTFQVLCFCVQVVVARECVRTFRRTFQLAHGEASRPVNSDSPEELGIGTVKKVGLLPLIHPDQRYFRSTSLLIFVAPLIIAVAYLYSRPRYFPEILSKIIGYHRNGHVESLLLSKQFAFIQDLQFTRNLSTLQ
jgi:hypothetical protein